MLCYIFANSINISKTNIFKIAQNELSAMLQADIGVNATDGGEGVVVRLWSKKYENIAVLKHSNYSPFHICAFFTYLTYCTSRFSGIFNPGSKWCCHPSAHPRYHPIKRSGHKHRLVMAILWDVTWGIADLPLWTMVSWLFPKRQGKAGLYML